MYQRLLRVCVSVRVSGGETRGLCLPEGVYVCKGLSVRTFDAKRFEVVVKGCGESWLSAWSVVVEAQGVW